jgi:hypothetical protein
MISQPFYVVCQHVSAKQGRENRSWMVGRNATTESIPRTVPKRKAPDHTVSHGIRAIRFPGKRGGRVESKVDFTGVRGVESGMWNIQLL